MKITLKELFDYQIKTDPVLKINISNIPESQHQFDIKFASLRIALFNAIDKMY